MLCLFWQSEWTIPDHSNLAMKFLLVVTVPFSYQYPILCAGLLFLFIYLAVEDIFDKALFNDSVKLPKHMSGSCLIIFSAHIMVVFVVPYSINYYF